MAPSITAQHLRRFTALILCLHTLSIPALAQNDLTYDLSPWVWNGSASVTTSHISFSNWAAGGNYTYMLGFTSSVSPQWSDSVWSFVGSWQGSFSVFKSKNQPHQKANDGLEINFKMGKLMIPLVHVVVFADLKTQFWPGYNVDIDPENYVSNFMAPAFLTNGIGADYREDQIGLSVVVTPLSTKQTIVLDRGVDPTQYGVAPGKKILSASGAYARIMFNNEIFPKITVSTRAILFADYSQNFSPDLMFTGEVDYMLTSNFKLFFSVELLNDDNINVSLYEDLDGDGSPDDFAGVGPRLQVFTQLGIGISVTF